MKKMKQNTDWRLKNKHKRFAAYFHFLGRVFCHGLCGARQMLILTLINTQGKFQHSEAVQNNIHTDETLQRHKNWTEPK